MHRSALEGRGSTQLLFSQLDPLARCMFCGRPRPIDVLVTWMCSRCKRRSLYELFWSIDVVPALPAGKEL